MTGQLVDLVAWIATLLFGVVMLLQLLLALGILPITIAWGGRQERLTVSLRIASLVAILVLGFFAYIIRYRAGLVGSPPIPTWVRIAAWVVTGFLGLNSLGNLASKSRSEKLVFGPISIALTIMCFLVAISNPG